MAIVFRGTTSFTVEQAAGIILDGVRPGAWCILVGDDAHDLDRMVRESPEAAYAPVFAQVLQGQGYLPWIG